MSKTQGTTNATDRNIKIIDVTTNNVSSSKHGFAPKGDGSTTTFLNGNGAYSTPAGGSGASIGLIQAMSIFKQR